MEEGGRNADQVSLPQLLQTLRSPATPEQQQQVLTILKSNPQLMTAFIKHRKAQQQAAQQNRTSSNTPPQELQNNSNQFQRGQEPNKSEE